MTATYVAKDDTDAITEMLGFEKPLSGYHDARVRAYLAAKWQGVEDWYARAEAEGRAAGIRAERNRRRRAARKARKRAR